MFTGLIQDVGRIVQIEESSDAPGRRLGIRTDLGLETFEIGESVAVDGVCLTVAALEEGAFFADLGPETLDVTRLNAREVGDGVHLERALRVGDRLGGHFVQGHVDAVGEVVERERDGDSLVLGLRVPEGFERWLIDKGAVAIDGASLTVNALEGRDFEVTLVPHTLAETRFGEYGPGRKVHLEGDMLGKYVERLLDGDPGARADQFPRPDGRMDDDHE